MQNHATGASMGIRQGSTSVVHSLPLNFNSTTNRKFLRVKASTAQPVLVEFGIITSTAFDAGTLNQFRIGTTSGGAELLALTNIPAINTLTAAGARLLFADTDIYVGLNLTGTAATAGAGYVIARLVEMNKTEPSSTSSIP
jgi:hypothetical protein